MQKFNTSGIVLGRTNYGEAARIITFLTPDHGKVKAMAKGVRKTKSKLAGGIELFSVSQIGILKGRGEIDTLISSRMVKHYGSIVKDLNRTNLAYELIKKLDKNTAEHPDADYFDLLKKSFEALDDQNINLDLIEAWFGAQLLRLSGHSLNLQTQKSGKKLQADKKYDFNIDSMSFEAGKTYGPDHIKLLRLLFSHNQPEVLQKIQSLPDLIKKVKAVLQLAAKSYLHD